MQNHLSCTCSYINDPWDFIYKLGLIIAGAGVEHLLLEHSWVPTTVGYPTIYWLIAWNIDFVSRMFPPKKLGLLGLNPFKMLVVDLLHEFKLGVWKAVSFTLYIFSMQLGLLATLLQSWIKGLSQFLTLLVMRDMLIIVIRFRLVPTFG